MAKPPHLVKIDITGKLPIDGDHHIGAWVFPPHVATGADVPLLFCLPGGSYSKAYWHLEVPGNPGYSFAEYFAAQGMLVIAADHINTGDSSRHSRAADLVPQVVADANTIAFEELRNRTAAGELVPGLPPVTIGRQVGVGHSMGAMQIIIQQSRHCSFDAVASLGYGTVGPIVSLPGADETYRATAEEVVQLAQAGTFDRPILLDRTAPAIRHHFYDNVPEPVMAADDLSLTGIPGVTGPLSIVPFVVSDHASRLKCPVFIGLGQRDSTPGHHEETRAFRSSSDITLYILEGSAHCHNTANTRHRLWSRLTGWIRSLDP